MDQKKIPLKKNCLFQIILARRHVKDIKYTYSTSLWLTSLLSRKHFCYFMISWKMSVTRSVRLFVSPFVNTRTRAAKKKSSIFREPITKVHLQIEFYDNFFKSLNFTQESSKLIHPIELEIRTLKFETVLITYNGIVI